MSPAQSAAVTPPKPCRSIKGRSLSLRHVLLLDPGGATGKCINCGHHMSSTAAAATCPKILTLVSEQSLTPPSPARRRPGS